MKEEFIELIERAFGRESKTPPPMTLRAGNALDDYEDPPAFDPRIDVPTGENLETFHWGLPHPDSRSWRYYLSFFIEYAVHHIKESSNEIPIDRLWLCVSGQQAICLMLVRCEDAAL